MTLYTTRKQKQKKNKRPQTPLKNTFTNAKGYEIHIIALLVNLQHKLLLMKWVKDKLNWVDEHPSKRNNIELENNMELNLKLE